MVIKINEKREIPVLSRTEIIGNLEFKKGATPSKGSVRDQIANELDIGKELIVVKHIYTAFGKEHARFLAYAYFSTEEKEKIEPRSKKKEGEEKKEGEQAAAKKDVKQAEVKKEEVKAEEKKE